MRLIVYVEDMAQLGLAKEAGASEVILQPEILARFGALGRSEIERLAIEAAALNLRPLLEWDILMTEDELEKAAAFFGELDHALFAAVRVQDPGALEVVLESSSLPVQPILETGNHNLESLKGWRDYVGARLDRMVLSVELTRDTLESYRQALNTELEFMILGRIPLFYTPRNLLSALLPEEDERRAKPLLSAVGESEESPHKGFPVVENRHGTFMFHIKHQFLLEHLDELAFLDAARVDLRFGADPRLLLDIRRVFDGELSGKEFKTLYPFDVIKGFYKVNKTDVLFKKLKNRRIQRKDDRYVGEVLEIAKGKHQVIRLKGKIPVNKGMRLLFVTPEGKELRAPVVELKNTSLKDLDRAAPGGLVLVNYLGGVWVKSQVYLEESED